jgi:SAM-dependent methyltransferase
VTPARLERRLAEAAASYYRSTGRAAYYSARGKLGQDPAFAAILAHGLIRDGARVLDLGCGRGLLPSWLRAARSAYDQEEWCDDWPAPPRGVHMRGIEHHAESVEQARRALGDGTAFELADILDADFAGADTIVLLDVLHYMDPDAQQAVFARIRRALPADGVLILRVGDAAAGLRFRLSRWVDQAVLLARGDGWSGLYCRSLSDWRAALAEHGLTSRVVPLPKRAFSADVLLLVRPQ